MAESSPGHLPIYDPTGKTIVGYRESGPQALPQGQGQTPAAPDYGFEAFLGKILGDAGGLQMSGSDHHAGFVFGSGPHQGKSKAQVIQAAREQWANMSPEQRQHYIEVGNNVDIRGGAAPDLPLRGPGAQSAPTAPSTGLPIAAPSFHSTGLDGKSNPTVGPFPGAAMRAASMQQQQQDRRQSAATAAQQTLDHYTQNPAAYVDRQTQARDADLEKSGIQDMGGGQRIMNNQYGSGFVTQAPAGQPRTPGRIFDEKGEVNLPACSQAGTMVYKKDATGNTAMHPTTQEAKSAIAAQQNIIAGANVAPGAPGSPEQRRAQDRTAAIAALPMSPAFNALSQQSTTNAIARGTAITNRELATPTATQRRVQSAASAVPLSIAPAPAPRSPRHHSPSMIIDLPSFEVFPVGPIRGITFDDLLSA